jgi:hypothetical protein
MSERVSLLYDDDTKTDFNDAGDLLYHVSKQGLAGVVEAVEEESGDTLYDRDELKGLVDQVREQGLEDREDYDELVA